VAARVERARDVAARPPPEKPAVCGPEYAAAPMVIGKQDSFAKLGGLVRSTATSLASRLLSTATGGIVRGGGGRKEKPDLRRDPIKNKHKVEVDDPATDIRLRIGGTLSSDELLLSTRLEKAEGKGTIHGIYIESEDCKRLFPVAYYAYEFWLEWKLTVSWTRTTTHYEDGKVDRDVSSGGFSDAGSELLASGEGIIPLSDALEGLPEELKGPLSEYQQALREEMGPPVWNRLGFGAPQSGARSVGTPFRPSPEDLEALRGGRMMAVVHVTRERGGLYESVGIPMRIAPGEGGRLDFERIPLD
jgi:hypothetical protein